jgi:hypothetical protein
MHTVMRTRFNRIQLKKRRQLKGLHLHTVTHVMHAAAAFGACALSLTHS